MRWLLLCLLLAGCATEKVVYVPTPVPCPKPMEIARPTLKVFELTESSIPADIIKAYVVDFGALLDYSSNLEGVLEGYR